MIRVQGLAYKQNLNEKEPWSDISTCLQRAAYSGPIRKTTPTRSPNKLLKHTVNTHMCGVLTRVLFCPTYPPRLKTPKPCVVPELELRDQIRAVSWQRVPGVTVGQVREDGLAVITTLRRSPPWPPVGPWSARTAECSGWQYTSRCVRAGGRG